MHPNGPGHAAIARLLVAALETHHSSRTSSPAGHLHANLTLPPPLRLSSEWEAIDAPWQCRTCYAEPIVRNESLPELSLRTRPAMAAQAAAVEQLPPIIPPPLPPPSPLTPQHEPSGCEELQPLASSGFRVSDASHVPIGKLNGPVDQGVHAWQPSERRGFVHASRKMGWTGWERGDTISFRVHAHARVLLSLLCSYIAGSVGNATAFLHSAGEEPTEGTGLALNLQWSQRSSQQCLADVGFTGASVHVVTLKVMSEGSASKHLNQVRLYGVYQQPRRREKRS